jgi:hypothetical protein
VTGNPQIGFRGGLRLAAFFSLVSIATVLPGCRRKGGFRVAREAPSEAAPPAATSGSAATLDPSLTPAEARAIREFLSTHSSWRIATDADARPPEDADDVSRLYGVYHPYFVRGDIDDDGGLDFVIAFVDRGKRSGSAWFSVVAFCADGHGGFRPPQMIESEISLEQGDLSIDRDSIVITPDLSEDDSSRRYRWNFHQHRFDFVTGEAGEPDRIPSSRI